MTNIDKLIEYAESQRVNVRFVRIVDESGLAIAGYSMKDNEIVLLMDLDLDDQYTTYVVAHELGHYIDFRKRNNDYLTMMLVAESIFDSCVKCSVETPKQVADTILVAEQKAFDNAERLLTKLKIDLPKTKKRQWRRTAVSDYRRAFRGELKWKKYS